MHWPLLEVRLNFKTSNTWSILVSICMWVSLCGSQQFFKIYFWRVLSMANLASGQNQNSGYAELWKPEGMKPQRMISFTGRQSHIIQSGDTVAVKVPDRGVFTLSLSCFSCIVHKNLEERQRCCTAPQCSQGVVRTQEDALWVDLSGTLVFMVHSYFSQGAAEVQTNPDKRGKDRS